MKDQTKQALGISLLLIIAVISMQLVVQLK